MRNKLWSLGFLLLTRMIHKMGSGQRQDFGNMAQLRMQLGYLKAIKTCRLLCISLLGVGIFFTLIISSFIVFNLSVFLYSPYSALTKMWIGILLSFVYLGIAAAVFFSVFTEDRWLYIFHAQNVGRDLEAEEEEPVSTTYRK